MIRLQTLSLASWAGARYKPEWDETVGKNQRSRQGKLPAAVLAGTYCGCALKFPTFLHLRHSLKNAHISCLTCKHVKITTEQTVLQSSLSQINLQNDFIILGQNFCLLILGQFDIIYIVVANCLKGKENIQIN